MLNVATITSTSETKSIQMAPAYTVQAIHEIQLSLNALLSDTFALYFKTKAAHWHMYGPQFRDYHLLLDEQALEIIASTDPIAERVRKVGGRTILSIHQAAKITQITSHIDEKTTPKEMIEDLLKDNQLLTKSLKLSHAVCLKNDDFASTSMLETFIDESEKRMWFLLEIIKS